jgi:hypothetical protein
VVDGGEEPVEALLGICSTAGSVDRSERLLQPPRLGEQRVAVEEHTELTTLALAQSLRGFE